MSERNEQYRIDLLDLATEALRNAPVLDRLPPGLSASTIEALQASDMPTGFIRIFNRRKLMFRMLRYSVAAAALVLVALAGALALLHGTNSLTFAQVVENINKAKTVSFVVKQKLGNQPELEFKMAMQGDMIRYELPDVLVMIIDTNQRKGLQLDVGRKVASKIDLEGRVPAEELADPIQRLRNLKENIKDQVDELADEELGGHKCKVYQVKGLVKDAGFLVPDKSKLWVDAKTGLPAKIHAADDKISLTFEGFKWDEPLKENLFSLEVPKGYLLEQLAPAVTKADRIYYQQGWVELQSLQPDEEKPEVQFVPRLINSHDAYVADKSELSPDGRYLAIGYTHSTDKGSYPPYRVLLWDRTKPKEEAVEVYERPEGELQSWRFSPDGGRLYVSWWEQVPGKKGPEGRTGTDVVDLKTKTKQAVKLPTYKDKEGHEREMAFGAASADGQTLLVVGQGLQVASAKGKLVRRLSASDTIVFPSSVRLSPDEKQVLYVTYRADDHSHQLFVASLTDGEPKELVAAGKFTNLRARWSPNGKRIAVTSRLLDTNNPPFSYGKETYLKIMNADGSTPVTLITKKVHSNEASLELTAWR
jgi:outer membrane lipoprotein-sorting protein